MKQLRGLILCLLLSLCLSGCAQAALPKAADGQEWGEDWVTVGNVVGVDTSEGLTPRENNDALSAKGMYYATWSAGEAIPYVNEDGEDVEVYDAQLYFLLSGYDSTEKAEDAAAEWLAMASEQYAVTGTSAETCNGQDFTVITHTYTSESNPYARGASAFGTYGNYAISAELSCGEGFGEDAGEVLRGFLENCHYVA